jgi:hypothetical protein
MHVKAYAPGIAAVLGATIVCFAGCGTTVHEATGGSGGAATTGSSASSASGGMTTAGSTSSASSSSSSGTGGENACETGCAHAMMCGLDICGTMGINCATVGTQYDCLANCLDAVPCAQLNQETALGCYESCQSADGGTSDGGSEL